MANTDYSDVLSAAGNVARAAVIQMLEQRSIYVIEDDEDPQDLTPGFATHLAFQGVVFWYDAADATTAHDGTACLVTADGKRFKADGLEGTQRRHWAVKDKDLSAPPGSPAIGDIYIVASGGSGAWAGKDKRVAVYTGRGWLFITPSAFDMATVIDESLIYHYSAGGAWTSGIGALTIGSNTVYPNAIKYARWGLSIVNQTTNAPPGSPADGDAYIIGSSPTGAWAGKARQIAIYQDTAWTYYVPVEGDHAYDKTLNAEYLYDGSTWSSLQSGFLQVASVETNAAAALTTGSVGSANDYEYSATTAPATSIGNAADSATLSFTARASGKIMEVEYSCMFLTADANITAFTFGLQIDSNANMSDWITVPVTASANGYFRGKFILTSSDTSAHTYTIRVFPTVASTPSTRSITLSRRRFQITERS